MAVSALSAPHFHDQAAAFAYVEARLWRRGPVCPHCGCTDRIRPLLGKTTRIGLRKCYDCRKNFTVRHGTVFADSHLDLHLWLQAIHLLCASKKGISSNQLHRMLGCTLKTAWFLSHRIREAMRSGDLNPMGGPGGIVEADETYIGTKSSVEKKSGYQHKRAVVSLVERGGSARTVHVDRATLASVSPIVSENIQRDATLMTDESRIYSAVGSRFADQQTVNQGAKECVRGVIHTNTVEGFFSIFKPGSKASTSIAGRSTCTATSPNMKSAKISICLGLSLQQPGPLRH